jgi:hypothetical protein
MGCIAPQRYKSKEPPAKALRGTFGHSAISKSMEEPSKVDPHVKYASGRFRESHTAFLLRRHDVAASTKAAEKKMPSGRRNGATRTMMRRTTPCIVSACSLNTADQKGFCFDSDLCDVHG